MKKHDWLLHDVWKFCIRCGEEGPHGYRTIKRKDGSRYPQLLNYCRGCARRMSAGSRIRRLA